MYDNFFKVTKLFVASILFLAVIPRDVVCQDKKVVDSLNHQIDITEGKAKLENIIQLSLEYYDIDNATALKYASQCLSLSEEYGDSLYIAKSGRLKGQLLRRLDDVDGAIAILKQVLPVAKHNHFVDEQKKILNGLAIAYTFKANYDEALKYNFESLLIREKEGNKAEISIALNNIGFVYFKLGNVDRAINYYEKSLRLKKESNDKYDLDRLFINLGLCYNQRLNFEKARDYINEGLSVCGDNCNSQINIEGHCGLGYSYYSEQNFEKARSHFLTSYQISKKEGSKRFQLENLIYLARIDLKLNRIGQAREYLSAAENIAINTEYNQLLIEIYFEFARLYNQSKEFQKAADYQGRYINLKDSIYSDALIRNLAKVQTDFEERENIATIATKEEVIKQQRSINLAIGVITILAILLITVLYHSNKVKKRVNDALSEAKNIIEMKNRELDKKVADKTADLEKANESLIKVNEELDNFIYKTSHDIRGPLASLKGICNVALMDVKDEVAIGYLSKLDLTAEHLNTVLTRLLIINQINNSSLKPERINFPALVDEVLALERKKGLPDRIKVIKHIEPGIDYQSDKEFVRIILDNLIGNAIKFHNDSGRVEPFVEINVAKQDEELMIRVVDNGIGLKNRDGGDKIFQMFSRASERSATGGIGLYITKLAAEKIHGQVGLKTTPEGYTEFFVRIPIEPVIQRFESELI